MASRTPKNNTTATVYAYQRIEDDLRAKVRDGRLPVGAMLASRHKLAREYGVALSTTQQAIANLIADGTLETSDRRGTFVSQRSSSLRQVHVTPANPLPLTPGDAASKLFSANIIPSRTVATKGTLGIVSTARIDTTASPDVGSLWGRQAIRALEQTFSAAGGTTRFFDRYPEHLGPYERGIDDSNAISMTTALQALRLEGCDALAIIGICDGRDMSDEIVAALDVENVPLVYISWHEMQPPLAQVYYDGRFAGYQAAQYLLRQGFTRLLALAPFAENWLTARIGGAQDAVRHAGLLPETLRVYPDQPRYGDYDPTVADNWAYEAALQAFAEEAIFTRTADRWGIIAPNDFTASGVLRAAIERGKVAGLDYGLIGFDDDPLSCSRGLTTIRPPIEAMGEEAGRILLRSLQGESVGANVCLRSQVIPRASTALPQSLSRRPAILHADQSPGSERDAEASTDEGIHR